MLHTKTKNIIISILIIIVLLFTINLFQNGNEIEKNNQKIEKAIEKNKKELEKIKTENEKIKNEIIKNGELIYNELSKKCPIEKYSDLNTKETCTKTELSDYIFKKTGFTIKQLHLQSKLDALEWYKKSPKDFSADDLKMLPKGSIVKDGIVLHKYTGVSDLYYGIHINDKPYVTQNMQNHYIANGRLAVDIGVNGQERYTYAPDYKNQEIEYIIRKTKSFDYGDGVELHFTINGSKYKWIYGHTEILKDYKDGDKIKTGDVFGKLNLTGITTGYHLHAELWNEDNQVLYVIENKLLKIREEKNINLK